MSKSVQTRNNQTNMFANTQSYFRQYCESTSIHGFQYLGEKRALFEKIWWITVFVACLSGCSFMIYKIYEKYETSPVIVSFATKETPLYKIPFPAVTICPETKSVKRSFDYTKVMMYELNNKSLTTTDNTNLHYMSLLCDESLKLENNWKNSTFSNKIFDTLDALKPDFLAQAYNCSFMNLQFPCEDLFFPLMTDEGVCYSFNILDRSYIFNDLVSHYKDYHQIPVGYKGSWNMEDGYVADNDIEDVFAYPRRALLAGATNGLTLNLATLKQDLDHRCKDVQGFKVIIHTPVRIPRLKQEFFRIPLDQTVVTAVQPVMITTSNEVKSFDADKRGCYFPSERRLKYFKSYSQRNCHLECLTNITLNTCDCVNIFMPKDNTTRICGTGNYTQCMKKAEHISQYMELFFHFYDRQDQEKIKFAEKMKDIDCHCLPLCTDLSYNTEISQTNWDWEKKFESYNSKTFNKSSIHLSSLTVYFKFNHFITSERHELYGPTDFIANFGGLLGLFTGFSLLSLMEIIYFLTIRICGNIRMYGRWTGTIQ